MHDTRKASVATQAVGTWKKTIRAFHEVEETGEVVTVARRADRVIRQHDKRAEVCRKIKRCLAA